MSAHRAETDDNFDLFTELEEALRAVYCVQAVLQKLVNASSNEDVPIYDLLADHLGTAHERAKRAFEGLHEEMVRRNHPELPAAPTVKRKRRRTSR
jgi:hypothetical protein